MALGGLQGLDSKNAQARSLIESLAMLMEKSEVKNGCWGVVKNEWCGVVNNEWCGVMEDGVVWCGVELIVL